MNRVHRIAKSRQRNMFFSNSAIVLRCKIKNYMYLNSFFNKWPVFIYVCPLHILSHSFKKKQDRTKQKEVVLIFQKYIL